MKELPLPRIAMRAFALLFVVLVGCNALTESRPGGPFRITIDHASYAPSYVVDITVTNVSRVDATYNLCPRAIQRRIGDAWQTVTSYPSGGACTAEAHLFRAGESIDVRVGLAYDLADGTYRIVLPWLGDPTLPEDGRATPSFAVSKLPIVALP